MPEATVCAVVLLIVPATNPVPVAVQVTLLIAMLSDPEIRSLFASTVRLHVAVFVVFTVTEIAF